MMVVEEVDVEEVMMVVEASEPNLPYRNCLVLILHFQVTDTAIQLDHYSLCLLTVCHKV